MVRDFHAKLTKRITIAPRIYHLTFNLKEKEEIDFVAGQYVLLQVGDVMRQYSIASPDYIKDHIDIILEYIEGGVASMYLKKLAIGDEVLFKGPAGVFTLKEASRNSMFLATGTGIAPIKSMIETYFHSSKVSKQMVHLFWGFKNIQDAYMIDLFEEIRTKNADRFDYTICFSREQSCNLPHAVIGRINSPLEQYLAKMKSSASDYNYYICGGPSSVVGLREFVQSLGVPKQQIYFERFA